MKAVIIGAAAMAAAGVNGEAAPKRELQTATEALGINTGTWTGADAPQYFFDFSNPAACMMDGKTVMDVNGKAKLRLKGGREGFLCNRGWRGSYDAIPSAVQAKVTPAAGYAVNYTTPTTAGGAVVVQGGLTCQADSNRMPGACTAGATLTGIICKAGYAPFGMLTNNAFTGTYTATNGVTGAYTATSEANAVCTLINECDSTTAPFKHQCNEYATCSEGANNAAIAGYKCTCNTYETNYQTTKDGAGAVAIGKQAAWDNDAACSALDGTGVGIYDWSAGIGGTPGRCNGLKGQTQKIAGTGMPDRVFGTFDHPVYTNSASGNVGGGDTFYNSNKGLTYIYTFSSEGVSNGMYSSGFKSHLGCGIQACERLFTDNNVNNVIGASWYNHSNWTNVTYADNCTADSLDYTGPSMNCTNGTTGENRPNCSDGHWNGSTAQHGGATQARQLGEVAHVGAGRKLFEARRLSANNDTNTSSAAAGASPVAAALPPNISATLAPGHAYFSKSPAGAPATDAAFVYNILHFDGIQDYAEMEAGDMTAGHAVGSKKYKGTPFTADLADDSSYASVNTQSDANGKMDLIDAAAGDGATYMFTFATTSTGAQALLEGYGSANGQSHNGQYGTMDFANMSSGAASFAAANKLMNDLLQINIDSQNVNVKAFGMTKGIRDDKHPLMTQLNYVNYATSDTPLPAAATISAATATADADKYVTLFVTTGAAVNGGVFAATSTTGFSTAATGGNCNYPQNVCTLEHSLIANSTEYSTAGRRLTASEKFAMVVDAKLRKLTASTIGNAATCAPENPSAAGAAGIPAIRRAHRLYALGRQQFTPDMAPSATSKEKAFSTCTDNCCCSAWQNASAAGACGTGANKGHPDTLNFKHYKYFSGNMRHFGMWSKQLDSAAMTAIVTALHMDIGAGTSGGASTSTSASAGGANEEYWHQCRAGIVNETDPCLAGNASHTLAERFALSTDAGCANTTECVEHSNSFQPVWNRNPAGASVTCNIDQLKFSMKFKVNVSSAADIAACIAAGTCVDDAGDAVKIPTLGGLTALPGGSEFGFNMTVELGQALATGIKYVLKEAENDAEGCTTAPADALLDSDPTDTVKETKTVTAASAVPCPKKFHFNGEADTTETDFTYAYKNKWHFAQLMNETDGMDEYGLSIDSFDTVSTTTETHLDEAERGEDNVASAATLLTAINTTTGEVELKFNRKLTFTMKGVTDNVADVIMESLEDEYYSDLISPVLHYLKKNAFTSDSTLDAAFKHVLTTGAGLEMYLATATDSESGVFSNVNMTLASGACTVTDSYGVVRNANGPDGSTSTSTSGSQTGSPGTSTEADDTTTTTAAKKKSSNAFRATGVSALASVFALLFAVFFNRQ